MVTDVIQALDIYNFSWSIIIDCLESILSDLKIRMTDCVLWLNQYQIFCELFMNFSWWVKNLSYNYAMSS